LGSRETCAGDAALAAAGVCTISSPFGDRGSALASELSRVVQPFESAGSRIGCGKRARSIRPAGRGSWQRRAAARQECIRADREAPDRDEAATGSDQQDREAWLGERVERTGGRHQLLRRASAWPSVRRRLPDLSASGSPSSARESGSRGEAAPGSGDPRPELSAMRDRRLLGAWRLLGSG
jgi:hypothetical protein